MDIFLKFRLTNAVFTAKMETMGNVIVARISTYIQIPNGGTLSIVGDFCWSSISAWELDARKYLERLSKKDNTIIEVHVKNTTTEAEKQIKETLLQILEFPER